MTNGLTVAPNERPVLRVFSLEMPRAVAMALRDAPWRDTLLGAQLGLDRLDPAHVEIVDTSDLTGVGLAGLLVEGHGADQAQVAADRSRLDAVQGCAMIVASGAFDGAAVTIHPKPDVHFVGVYREDVPAVRFEPLPAGSAQGSLNPDPPPPLPAARSGRPLFLIVALAALAVLVLLAVIRTATG
jgi:hypothetical protein